MSLLPTTLRVVTEKKVKWGHQLSLLKLQGLITLKRTIMRCTDTGKLRNSLKKKMWVDKQHNRWVTRGVMWVYNSN